MKSFFLPKYSSLSFSQSGEDLIVRFIFSALGIAKPTFFDIGAHHPEYLSNTALFYRSGSRGINVEPDPNLFQAFTKERRQDINLNLGVGARQGKMDFYVMSSSTMNTFSEKDAEKLVHENHMEIKKVIPVPVDTISNIIERHSDGQFPDFLSLDVEGMDLEILQTIDYPHKCPKVICVETISFSTNGRGEKDSDICRFLQKQDYILYADTYINSIFVRRSLWER